MRETEVTVLYATHDGHTRKIAAHLAHILSEAGRIVTLCDLGREEPDPMDISSSEMIVFIAPIRYGHHQKSVEHFLARNKQTLSEKKIAIASVNLTARKEGKNAPETNPYFRKWMKRQKLAPALQAVFAGHLDYSLYRWWEKYMIRLIMYITGGPTNFDAVVDYTNWAQVDAFAAQIAGLVTEEERAA